MLIAWSGGLDSTYLLWTALTHFQGAFANETVRTMSLNHCSMNNGTQQARQDIIAWFTERNLFWTHGEVKTTMTDIWPVKVGMWQQPLVVTQAALFAEDGETFAYSLCTGDCALTMLHDLRMLYEQTVKCQDKRGTITFPLCQVTKAQMLHQMPRDLVRLTVSCEENTSRKLNPCMCSPCMRRAAANAELQALIEMRDAQTCDNRTWTAYLRDTPAQWLTSQAMCEWLDQQPQTIDDAPVKLNDDVASVL